MAAETRASAIPGRWIAVLFALLTAAMLAPLFAVSIPIGIDYPNHLARVWIQMDTTGRAAADANYVLRWQLIPNLSMEAILPLLAAFLPLEVAGRVFLAAAIAMPALATLLLHRTLHGQTGLWPLTALLFTYNAVLYWGFVNYLFGLGAALLCFWLWVALARVRMAWRLCVFAPLAAGLFLLHLFAFGLYGLLVLGFEVANRGMPLFRAVLARRTLLALLQFIPAGLLWLLALGNGGPGLTAYGDVWMKLNALQAPMAFGALPGALAMALLVPTVIAMRRGVLRVHPLMKWPLIMLVMAALAMPNWILGSWGADMRLPVALPFVLIAATQPRWPVAPALASVALGFLLVRIWSLTLNWQAIDRDFMEFRAAAAVIPIHARLLPVLAALPEDRKEIPGLPTLLGGRAKRDYNHMAALAVVDRGAFIPNLFTGWTQILPAARNAGLAISQDDPISPEQLRHGALPVAHRPPLPVTTNRLDEAPYWLDWPGKFEFVLWIDFGTAEDVPPVLTEVAKGSFFRIYRVDPAARIR